jgi:hypothetical protein
MNNEEPVQMRLDYILADVNGDYTTESERILASELRRAREKLAGCKAMLKIKQDDWIKSCQEAEKAEKELAESESALSKNIMQIKILDRELAEAKNRIKLLGDEVCGSACVKDRALLAQERARSERLREALVESAVPLEALKSSEGNGHALSPELKTGINRAIVKIMEALAADGKGV